MDLNLEALTVQLIEEYYANDRRLFFEYMDDDIIWIGPAIRQYYRRQAESVKCFCTGKSFPAVSYCPDVLPYGHRVPLLL